MSMTTKELARYNKLIQQATGFFRRDAEGKFRFAAMLKELHELSEDAGLISKDLGMSGRAEVENYIAVLDFWGDERIPDFPMQPARWSHYRNVVFNWYWHDNPKMQAKAKAAALKGGNYEVGQLERQLKAKADEARLKELDARPQAEKDDEQRRMVLRHVRSALFNARVWIGKDTAELLRSEDRVLLRKEFNALTYALIEAEVVHAGGSDSAVAS